MTAKEIKDKAAQECGYKDIEHFKECFRDNVTYGADFDNIIGKITQAYHTAKLEEVRGLPDVNGIEKFADKHASKFIDGRESFYAFKEGMKQMRSIAQSVIAKEREEKDNIIKMRNESLTIIARQDAEISTLKAEIANLKEANIEYIGEVERLKEKECEHPFSYVNSRCGGEINQCLKCGKDL